MFTEPTPGAAYGCHDRNLGLGFQIVIDVVGPTAERLSSPEYDVWVYDQAHPRGRTMTLPMFSFLDDYVRPLTALEREQRLAALHYPVR
jgi:hypothetical protein